MIAEKKNNFILFVKKFNLFYIEHKDNVGGRYSVLSEVGIIPAFKGYKCTQAESKILNCLNVKIRLF